MLTAMSESKDRIDGLQKGVDDYMGKPFDPQELLLRIKAILRRMKKPKREKNDELVFGDCIYNINKNILIKKGLNIHLTLAETDLLRILAINANLPVNRNIIINSGTTLNSPRTVDVHITRLRKKIEIEPHNPRYLQTIRGKGYLLRTN
jgi:two-component system phosphate regulon response regulator OmpR